MARVVPESVALVLIYSDTYVRMRRKCDATGALVAAEKCGHVPCINGQTML